jgi:hypothetical protein
MPFGCETVGRPTSAGLATARERAGCRSEMRLDPPDPGRSLEHTAHAAPVQMPALADAGLKASASLHGRVSGGAGTGRERPERAGRMRAVGISRLLLACRRVWAEKFASVNSAVFSAERPGCLPQAQQGKGTPGSA